MPHPVLLPLFGTKLNFLFTGSGTRLHEYVDQRHKQLGPIFNECLGGKIPLVFISDPNLMKSLFLNLEGKYPAHILPEPWVLYEKLYGFQRGLFFMDGEEWLNNRRAINKHLLREDADKWLTSPIKETVSKFIENWKTRAENKSFSPNLESEFYKLSTDVIINVLLGTESSLTKTKHYEELLSRFSEEVKKIFQTTTKLYGLPVHWLQRLNTKQWREFKECVDLSLKLAHKIVEEMLSVQSETNGLVRKLYSEGMSDALVQRIAADFVIAAGDTSTYTTLWTLHLLVKNEPMKDEVRSKDDSYVRSVLKETMRLYPVAPFLTRILPKTSMLGPYTLEKGTPIIGSIYTSGRDEQNFSRATEFLPYRWDRSDPRRATLENHVPSASLPFALGSRSCIGKKIAMLQLTEIIKQILDNFDLKSANNAEIKPITSGVLVPNQPIELVLSLRK
ncbi:cytochrome p450 domain-containing protein [Phthorimaea operculella]|nr:cytochrome p450 domain-containing protein [Phthorimaea operculella]